MELNTVIEKHGRSRVKTHATRFTWFIENIWNCPIQRGESYFSPSFSVGEHEEYSCSLHFYLNGYYYDDDIYVGLLPIMEKKDGEFEEVLVEISILDENATAYITKRASFSIENLESQTGEDIFQKFAKKDDLSKIPSFLARGNLKIVCTIYFYINSVNNDHDVSVMTAANEKIHDHLADFEKLLFNSDFSDFQLIIGDTKIPVHRAILAARSSVFAAMLSNDMLEKSNGCVKIEDVDIEVMHELLRFVYIGQVCNLDKIAHKILIVADKYEVNSLKQICENALVTRLSSDSIFETLRLVDRYDAATLKKATIDYVMKHSKELVAKDDFDVSMKLIARSVSRSYTRFGI